MNNHGTFLERLITPALLVGVILAIVGVRNFDLSLQTLSRH